MINVLKLAAWTLAALAASAPVAGAAHVAPATGEQSERHDPYTRGQADALSAAGYVAMHPIPWADGHGSSEIEETLGKGAMLWVETAHFRIGSSLPRTLQVAL